MRALRWLGPGLLALGVAALIMGFLQDQATLNLVVIFPVITATGAWSALGIVLIIAGFFAVFLTWPAWRGPASTDEPFVSSAPTLQPSSGPAAPNAPSRRWGGIVFLGPFPIAFGSDAKVTKWMLVAGFLLFAALVVFTVIAIWGI